MYEHELILPVGIRQYDAPNAALQRPTNIFSTILTRRLTASLQTDDFFNLYTVFGISSFNGYAQFSNSFQFLFRESKKLTFLRFLP
jgi:hypothetical protein